MNVKQKIQRKETTNDNTGSNDALWGVYPQKQRRPTAVVYKSASVVGITLRKILNLSKVPFIHEDNGIIISSS